MLTIPQEIDSIWGAHETYIAQLELLVVLAAMVEFASAIHHCKGLWFIGSVAALMELVRGNSDSPSLDVVAQLHLTAL